MKKSFSLLFICLIISCFAYSKTLFTKHGTISNTYTNQYNDPDWSIEISSADEEGAFINGICYIKEGCQFQIDYNSAIVGGQGDGTSQGSGGSETSTCAYITKPNKIRNQIYGNTTIVCNKDDCFCIELYICGNNNEPETPAFLVQICAVNEIYYNAGDPYVAFSGNIDFYSGKIVLNGTCRFYELLTSCENVYAIHENDTFPKYYVKKDSKIKLDFTGASITEKSERYEKIRYVNVSGKLKLNEEQTVEENTDINISVCQDGIYGGVSERHRFSIIVDDNPPEITVNPKITEGEWYTRDIEISASDGESQIRQLLVEKTERNISEYYESSRGECIPLTESGKYKIKATDNVGNVSSKEVWIDKEVPILKISDEKGEEPVQRNEWYSSKKIIITADDNLSGIESLKINGIAVGNPYEIKDNGIYTVDVKDKAGNSIETKTIKLDNTKPVITQIALQYTKNERLITAITALSDVKDDDSSELSYSGLSNDVYIKNNDVIIKQGESTNEENKKIINAMFENINRTELQVYELKVIAKDNAGNSDESTHKKIYLPPEIKVQTEKTYIEDNNTVTELKLKNYSGNEEYYIGLKLKRTIYIDGKEVTEENFTKYFEEDARANWRAVTAEKDINRDEIKNGIYKDRLLTESGFGHKETGYKIRWQLRDCLENEKGIWEESEEKRTVTANNPGKVRIKIEGRGEEKEVDFTEGKFTDGTEGIRLAADGAVRIHISIEDSDYEPYEMELRQMIPIKGSEESLSLARPGFIQRGTSGKARYNGYGERYEKGKWISFGQMEYLAYNRETCLYLRVKAGYSGNEKTGESGRIYLKAEPSDLGGFILKVCDEAQYNANGITATPNQKIGLELSGDAEDAQWSYGDGITGSGKNVEHSWLQKEDRRGDTSEYELQIKHKNNELVIPVHITDTKVGALYGDETWWGNHEVLGKIEVNAGQTLIIGNPHRNEGIEILCTGDEEENYMGCLEIRGKLKTDNGTGIVEVAAGINTEDGLKKETETEGRRFLYWKGIEVNGGGEAFIKDTEISGGLRGIAVDAGGKVEVRDSGLKRNGIGIHVLGEVEAEGIEVSGSVEYGIKEEDGSSVKIRDSVIKENTENWYSAENSVLSIDEINGKLGE